MDLTTRDERGARDYFERCACNFDHLYDDYGKGPIARFIDTRLRAEMRIRFEKTFEALEPLRGRSMFDAGCGGGRYAIPAAEAGASKVLGIDFSAAMVNLARKKAAAASLSDVCRFEIADLLTFPVADKSFDYAIAIGFFDYQKDPVAALRALARVARLRVFVSLPKRWHVLTAQRYVRYTLFRCYIRFYSLAEVERLAASVNPRCSTILDIGREYNLRLDM